MTIVKALRVLSVVVALMFVSEAWATHFRSGSITWTRVSETATHVTIQLSVTTSWANNAPTSLIFTRSGGNTGTVTVPLSTTYNGQWYTSVGTANTTLLKTATLTTIRNSSCCKISTAQNNPDGNWDIYTVINSNAPGSGPVSTMPAIINMAIGQSAASYTVPATDPDPGSTLTFGVPPFTGQLSGQSNPSGFSISSTGIITFNTVGKTAGQEFNALINVTDNHGNVLIIDFLIRMTAPSTPPVFDYSISPANGYEYNIVPTQNVTFQIKATDSDPSSSVSLAVSGLPAYITSSNFTSAPLPATGNPSITTFSYTPTISHVGNVIVMNFTATDNVGVQSSTSITIRVVAEPAPVFIAPTPAEGTVITLPTGVPYQQIIRAESPNGSPVSISFASGAPAGVSFSPTIPTAGSDPGETTLSWTPTSANFGQHTITVQASIAAVPGIFSSRSFIRIVNTDPVFASTPPTTAVVGQLYTYSITVTDPDIPFGDVLDIVAGQIPSWLSLVQTGANTATLSGTPSPSHIGSHTVHIEAEDTYHSSPHVHQEYTVTVNPPINCIADQFVNTNTAGCTYLHTTSAWNATANVTCPTSELLRTNFDVDAQGWTKKASGDASSYITHWNGSGNNHIILVEGGQGNQDWFQAPDLFLGNRAGFMGGSLTFELKTNNTTNPLTHQDHVQLVGNGLTIYATIPWPTTSFVAHSIPFGTGYWKLSGTNTMATADEILGVLSSLQAFYIRAEWRSGVEETGLNDVRFHPGILMHTLTGATTGRVGKLSNVHFNPGVTTVTALVSNPCGDTYTCSFTITVTPPNTYYRDADNDGYGDLANDTLYCATPPPGYVANNLDCDDGSANLTIAGNTCDDGDPATTNDVVTATCTCEGILVVALEMKALLQGAMDLAGTHMRDDLRAAALLPLAHPYSGPPFNVPALITMAPALLTNSDANDAVVDWVLLELRDPSDASLVLHKLPVLLQRDGDLVMADGTLPIRFAGVAPASFHIAVRHRNHLGVMTAAPIALGFTATTVDLTDENTATYGTNARMISGGKAMLWCGNTNADFRLRYSGSGNDRDPIIQQIYQEHPLPVPTSVVQNVYSNNDVNLDGVVKYANGANDRDPILVNIGGTVSTATRMEQLP